MISRITFGASGTLALLALATAAPAVPFTLPVPLSAGHATLVAAFLATIPFVLAWPPRHRLGIAAHLAVTGTALVLHPMTILGRDGTTVVLALHLFLVVWLRTRLAPEPKLVAVGAFVGLLAGETLLARVPPFRLPSGVLDYGDLMLADDRPGELKPDLDVRILTERGTGRFVTDSNGHRNARGVSLPKEAGLYRLLLLGDSFATGYRVDQNAFIGARLERELRAVRDRSEVVVLGAGHPGYARWALERKGLRLAPDVVVLGLTLGNDLQSSWASRRGLNPSALEHFVLPDDSFLGALELLPLALDRSLSSWRTYRRVTSLWRAETIAAWYPDAPRRVHLFDPGHGLGFFYVRRRLPVVTDAIEKTLDDLAEMRALCVSQQTPFVVAFFPQRFQVHSREWPGTLWKWGLDREAFDPEALNRALLDGCRSRGIDCFDLLPDLRRSCDGPCYLSQGDMHWNERGHAAAAAALARALRRQPDERATRQSLSPTARRLTELMSSAGRDIRRRAIRAGRAWARLVHHHEVEVAAGPRASPPRLRRSRRARDGSPATTIARLHRLL